jgi:hypothetical protein
LLEAAAHHVGVFPVIRRAGGIARKRTYKGAVFDAGHIIRGRACVKTSRPLFLIEARECARRYEAVAKKFILRLGAIDPMNRVGPAELRHLFDPSNKVLVSRGRSLKCGWLVVENGLLHFLKFSCAAYQLQATEIVVTVEVEET